MKIVTETLIAVIKDILKRNPINQVSRKFCNINERASDEGKSTDSGFLPDIIFWDPLVDKSIELICPHCLEDTGKRALLKDSNEWAISKLDSTGPKPRTIWSVGWLCCIVGKIYKCTEKSHSIISYHAGILHQLPFWNIPFILTHDSGFTTDLHDIVLRMVESGSSFQAIHKFLSESFIDKYMRRKICFDKTYPLKQDTFSCTAPSVNTIIDILVIFYNHYKELFSKHFGEIGFSSLSLDHTFKVATNIGYMNSEKKWIKQYDSILIVLNEKGEAKKFKLTKGTSLEKYKYVFKDLSEENSNPLFIFVDNCCNVRLILNSVFPNSKVKLDLFHAVQRLTKHVSKKHPFYFEFVKEVGLIFRFSDDFGPIRTKQTPQPDVIAKNLDDFLKKWRDISFNNWKLMSSKVLIEFEHIKAHIMSGCLSEIPVGMGTNSNEALHKFMKQFGRSRLSVQTAESLLNLVLYAANCNKRCKAENKTSNKNLPIIVPPIWSVYPFEMAKKIPMVIIEQPASDLDLLQTMEIDFDEKIDTPGLFDPTFFEKYIFPSHPLLPLSFEKFKYRCNK